MFTLKSVLTALSLLAAVASVDARNHSQIRRGGLARRRCRASPNGNSNGAGGGGGGVVNVGTKPGKGTPHDTVDTPEPSSPSKPEPTSPSKPVSGCFPSAGFNMPDSPSGIDVNDWWCSRSSEYAFLGFSYGVDGCPTKSAMTSSFRQMKNDFGARYVRLYGSCDRNNFNSDVVDAAYDAGLGVYALVWFGFTGGNEWKNRLDDLLGAIRENPRAPYVIRNIAFGSEALYDNVMPPNQLISHINSIRDEVRSKGIEVSLSDMVYKLEQNRNVLDAIDNVQLNVLPFFADDATFGSNARNRVTSSLQAIANISDKKIVMTQTGWPSEDTIWKANAKSAVSNVASEKAYFDLLDDLCPTFKDGPKGGFGWFAHIFEDNNLRGWGIVRNGQPKFNFQARTKC